MLGKSKLKYIQSLGQKKLRDEEALFVAEGPKLVAELMASDKANLLQIYALKKWMEEHTGRLKGIELHEVSEDELGKISQLITPNQVLAVIKKFPEPFIETRKKLTLVLDTLQDPGNLGTIIRIADWFGVGQLVCSPDCADLYNPKVVQATMGSIARIKILYTDLPAWLSLQTAVPVFAATLDGEDVTTRNKKLQEGIIVIGNESKGISSGILKFVNEKISIPRKGNAESLNAAIATGIILSHIV